MGPDHRVVVDDRVVVEDRPRDRFAAAQDRQAAERVVGRQELARDADPVVHLDDRTHPLDLVGVVQDPGVAEPVEQDVEAELLAHAVVLGLAGEGDVGQLLGQLHRPDARDVPPGRPAARVAAFEDDDVADAASSELPGEGEAADPGTDDDDFGGRGQRTGRGERPMPRTRASSSAADQVAEADRAERRPGGRGRPVRGAGEARERLEALLALARPGQRARPSLDEFGSS